MEQGDAPCTWQQGSFAWSSGLHEPGQGHLQGTGIPSAFCSLIIACDLAVQVARHAFHVMLVQVSMPSLPVCSANWRKSFQSYFKFYYICSHIHTSHSTGVWRSEVKGQRSTLYTCSHLMPSPGLQSKPLCLLNHVAGPENPALNFMPYIFVNLLIGSPALQIFAEQILCTCAFLFCGHIPQQTVY